MEQLRHQFPIKILFMSGSVLMLIACIAVTSLPFTVLALPIIAYCCMRLYKQLKYVQLDAFNVLFDVGCVLASVTLFITTHTALY